METGKENKNIKYKLKGHETFSIREGWLSKGIKAVAENPKVFTEMYGADALGVGSNMAKAIRYWLKACGLTIETPGKGVSLSEFGKAVLQYDPYFEENFTLWCIHINLVRNRENATCWYLFFKNNNLEEFTREEFENFMQEQFTKYAGTKEYSVRSLRDDCNVLLQMYSKEKVTENDPEDKKICPLSKLGVLRKSGNSYKRTMPDYSSISSDVLLYLLQGYSKETAISMEYLYSGELGVQSVLGIGGSMYQEYLEELAGEGYIDINRTAGLDMIYKLNQLSEKDIVLKFYEK